MPSDTPLVSIIVPAHCAGRFIGRTLESILSQTYKNMEVLVVDDGSTDETNEIARRFAQADHRVRILRQNNRGVAAARNFGISHASGEFIAPIDADDLWLPENLEKQVAKLRSAGDDCGAVYSWSFDIDETDRALGSFHAYKIEGDVYATLLCHNFLGNASCTLIRASCLRAVGAYSLAFGQQGMQGCEDWELYARIAKKYRFEVVPEFLVAYRKSATSMSGNCESMAQSHAMVLRCSERAGPLPQLVRRLSTSSFYLYLAHLSAEYGRDANVLLWLSKALRAEAITPLLRLDVYTLFVKALMNTHFEQAAAQQTKPGANSGKWDGKTFVPQWATFYWRLILGSVVHICVHFLFENACNRRKEYVAIDCFTAVASISNAKPN